MNLQEEQEVITLSEICRVCLLKTDNMKHLLDPNADIVQTITKLSSVSNIEIEVNDILPCFLCNSCEEKLKISYDFQQLCQKTHNFLLTCVSASSISFKVNSLKPLPFDDSSERIGIQSVDNSENFDSFVDNDGPSKKVLISYYSVPDLDLSSNVNNGILKENVDAAIKNWAQQTVDNLETENNPKDVSESCAQEVNEDENGIDNSGLIKEDATENVNIREQKVVEDEDVKPMEIEKRTKYKQTMRLPQFPREDVDKVVQQFREKFMKHVDCKQCGFIAKDSRALSAHMTRLHKEMKKYWCFWCNDNFDKIQEHTETIHKDNLKCPLCGKHKSNTGHFMEHLASHCTERNHICRVCSKCFISRRHLRVHFRTHIDEKPYQCPICSKVFTMPEKLSNHFKIHKKHKCKVCEDRFLTVDEYNEHRCFSKKESEDIVDTIVKDLEGSIDKNEKLPKNFCQTCNKRVRSLPKHLSSVHSIYADKKHDKTTKDKTVLCSYCGKRFETVAKLTVHVRYHTGEMPYKCSHCDKRTKTRIQLVMHERTHTGEKPYKCKFCGKAFAQSSVLKTHLKQHTGRPEECFMCQKRFCRPSELRLHMRIHTGEKPYECNICGQSFIQQSRLTEHSRSHSNERPYKCEYCDKSFKQSSTLKYHTNIHLGKKPYKCPQCPYESRRKYCLNQHMLQHKNKPTLDRVHECEICCQTFTNFEMYSLHYDNEHGSIMEDGIVKEDLIEAAAVEVIDHLNEFT